MTNNFKVLLEAMGSKGPVFWFYNGGRIMRVVGNTTNVPNNGWYGDYDPIKQKVNVYTNNDDLSFTAELAQAIKKEFGENYIIHIHGGKEHKQLMNGKKRDTYYNA